MGGPFLGGIWGVGSQRRREGSVTGLVVDRHKQGLATSALGIIKCHTW